MKKTILTMSALLVAGGIATAQTAPAPGTQQTVPPAPQNQTAPGVTPPAGLEPSNRPATGTGTTGMGTTGSGTGTTSPLPAPRANVDTNGPLPGANSFTENQARERLETGGFSGVTNLRKDDQGIWRGTAMRNGASVPVAVDYRGNIFQQ
jgi:hypothetical protein